MRKLVTVIGARPQFIKAAPVSQALARSAVFAEEIIHTGQHFDSKMSEVFFREMGIPEPSVNLGIAGGSHGDMTGRMLMAIERELVEKKPDCVLVYGDTNSTLAGALAAAKLMIPVAHVEAGLRSHNRAMPEELNRIMVDHLSILLFCPSHLSADNLRAEGIGARGNDSTNGSKAFAVSPEVMVTGDVMVDSIRIFRDKASSRVCLLEQLGIEPNDYVIATIHRPQNTDNHQNLISILQALKKIAASGTAVILPLHPRTRKVVETLGIGFPDGVTVTEPVSYLDMLMLMERSLCVFTDSGGMQKEAIILGRPCVTMRSETEWVETVESGWNIVSGTKTERILEAYHTVRNHAAHAVEPPQELYGDGHAAERITSALEKRFTGC